MINVFHIVTNKHWAGPEQYTYDLAALLRQDDDFYVEVVCRKNPKVLKQFRRLEIPISILPLKGVTDIDTPVRFARLLRKGKNIIHVHSFKAAFMAVMARRISENRNTRIIVSVHGVYKPKKNYMYTKLYKSIDCFVFSSQMARDAFMGKAKKQYADRTVVIRDSVCDSQLGTAIPDLRRELNMEPQQALIMYHGRLAHEKGLDTLIEALKHIDKSKYHLAVIGEGQPKYKALFKAAIVAGGLVNNVTLLGFRDNILEYLRQADFGVLPSIQPEALGITNLEYMMAGKAHICSDNGAQPEYVIDGENGLLVPAGDEMALAEAINKLLDDTATRSRLGAQAQHDFQEKLDYPVFYQKMTDLYRQLLKNKPVVNIEPLENE
ncbi:MAG: glycosyltransferase family 4 protein [Muribaculaceae bacterium]|nr:glycosyltransferase family 4 protein [Muribaculaceae bacterium]